MAFVSLPSFGVTGPVHHWVQVGGQNYYLGTAEVTPKLEIRPNFKDVFNDIGGRSVPMQRTEDGETAAIGTLLNRFSRAALNIIQNLGPSVAKGQRNRFSRGSLAFGRSTFQFWLVYDNATDAVERARYPGLALGYYFPQTQIAGLAEDTLGTEAQKTLLTLEAYPYWQPQQTVNTVAAGERSWLLYGQDDSYFPADILVPQ